MSRDGFNVNGKSISALVGVVTLFIALCTGVAYVVGQSFTVNHLDKRVTQIEAKQAADIATLRAEMKESDLQTRRTYENILTKVELLAGEITKLTIALGTIEYRQEMLPQQSDALRAK